MHLPRDSDWRPTFLYAYLMQKDFDRAALDYDTAIKFAPQIEDVWFGRGKLWAERGEHQRAIDPPHLRVGKGEKVR